MKHIVLRATARKLGYLAVGAFWLLAPSAPSQAADTNHCVECHEKEALPISLGHSFPEWRGSSHAKAGVSCEKCHGGDPKKSDPGTAHEGVLPASDAKSLVSSERVAAMCGSCHETEYKAFQSTVHAEPDDEDRATCLTCHGSMATSLPTPGVSRGCPGRRHTAGPKRPRSRPPPRPGGPPTRCLRTGSCGRVSRTWTQDRTALRQNRSCRRLIPLPLAGELYTGGWGGAVMTSTLSFSR